MEEIENLISGRFLKSSTSKVSLPEPEGPEIINIPPLFILILLKVYLAVAKARRQLFIG